jgi:heme A synthase
MRQEDIFSTIQRSIAYAANDVFIAFIEFLPRLFAALIFLLVALLLSKFAKMVVKGALHTIRLDRLVINANARKFLEEADIRLKLEDILGEIVRWVIMYIFLISFFNILGLDAVANFLTSILAIIPSILAAILIFAIAVIAAGFMEHLVKTAIAPIDPATARLSGKIASYTVVVLGLLIAISELGIAQWFINILFLGFVATLSLAVGLALGLGSKDIVGEILTNWFKNYHKRK